MDEITTLRDGPVRYFQRADGEVAYCTQCMGMTLTFSIMEGGLLIGGERVYLGLNGEVYLEMDAETVQAWRDSALQWSNGEWVCDHEMTAHLNTRVC